MNINDFQQSANTYGFASPNKFEVDISLPNILNNVNGNFILNQFAGTQNLTNGSQNPIINQFSTGSNFFRVRADSVILPGVAFLTNDTNKLGVGPRIKQPYNAVTSDCHVQFLNDAEGLLESFFSIWTNFCFNYSEDNVSQTASYYTNYRQDITTTIKIYKYDDAGNVINVYTLIGALPTMVTPIRLGWDQLNSKIKILVNFSYQNFAISAT